MSQEEKTPEQLAQEIAALQQQLHALTARQAATESEAQTDSAEIEGSENVTAVSESIAIGGSARIVIRGDNNSVRAILDTAWTGTLFLLVGLLGGSVRSTALLAAASAVLVVVAVEASPLVRGPPLEWIGLMMGIAAGYLLRPLVHDLVGRGVP